MPAVAVSVPPETATVAVLATFEVETAASVSVAPAVVGADAIEVITFDAAVRLGYLKDSTLVSRRIAPLRGVIVASTAYLSRHWDACVSHRSFGTRVPGPHGSTRTFRMAV